MTVINENGCLKVLLTATETVEFGVDELFLELETPKAHKILLKVLKQAAARGGFCLKSDKVEIEIRPLFTGNCEILFIPERKSAALKVTPRLRYVCSVAEFSNSEDMLTTIEKLYLNEFAANDSRLYTKNGVYRLVLNHPKRNTLLKELNCNVSVSPYLIAATVEHWTPLCEKNAIETVGKALKRN